MKRLFLCLTGVLCAAAVSAQPSPNNDGTVTFRYKNDSAKNVQVDVQFCGRKDMKRGADGTSARQLPTSTPTTISSTV